MRLEIEHLNTATVAWSVSADGGAATKIINTDSITGDRTVLLRSARREDSPATRRRAHYHHGGEEFLTLGAAFTFDANIWLPRHSYVYLPPFTVHGTDICVPDGYLMYLRTEAPGEPVFEPDAGPEMAFTHIDTKATNSGVVIEPGPLPNVRANGPSRLLRLTPGFTGALGIDENRACEIFVAQGEFQTTKGQIFGAESYACLPAGSKIEVASVLSESLVLISACRMSAPKVICKAL